MAVTPVDGAPGDMPPAPPEAPPAPTKAPRTPRSAPAGPKPDPELLRKDPLAEMFGPGTGIKLYGNTEEDQIPDEIRAVLDTHGLGKKSFQCMLKEIPKGSTIDGEQGSNAVYLKGFTRGIPSPDYIAREYGPGDYILAFSWQTKDDDGTRHMNREEVPISISEKVMGEYKRNRLESKIKAATEVGTQVHEALMEKSIEGEMIKALVKDPKGDGKDAKTTAKEYIQEVIETARMVGLSPIASQVPAKSIDWEKILPALMTGVTAFLTMQQNAEAARRDESMKMLMMIMSTTQNANQQMLELMKVQSGAGSGNLAIKEFKDMIFGALDIKNALSGNEKETLGDKIFRLVENVAPSILSIAATTAQNATAAANNPMVKMAKQYVETNPDFVALKQNPVEMKKTIDKMDHVYGWVQVDHILNTMGWPRPAECPRVPELRDPAPDPEDAQIDPLPGANGEPQGAGSAPEGAQQ